ncbi:hypothetical protein CHLRE_10g419900v5 [Chlamydomonas reinhardtii]|uniref:Uncharacterized protein n=1 Tax=Chlamydomonas reinhardtii TaxID=3055 RepID=A0A2K3D930_CHLRE|nr:uncharacterized protein CHLRE_10g419900v5 [Chlamydomonas reinhardtii]PNW77042.1 hypothetical protein CHLRE_10g419900v5 [Chlamydomonas reinhardtii]
MTVAHRPPTPCPQAACCRKTPPPQVGRALQPVRGGSGTFFRGYNTPDFVALLRGWGAAIPGINATVDCQLHAASRRCVRVDSINSFIPLFSNGTVALASMVVQGAQQDLLAAVTKLNCTEQQAGSSAEAWFGESADDVRDLYGEYDAFLLAVGSASSHGGSRAGRQQRVRRGAHAVLPHARRQRNTRLHRNGMAVVSKDEVFLRRPPLWLALHVLIHQISKFLDMRYVGGGLHGETQLLDVRARAANGMDAVVRSAKLVFGVGPGPDPANDELVAGPMPPK